MDTHLLFKVHLLSLQSIHTYIHTYIHMFSGTSTIIYVCIYIYIHILTYNHGYAPSLQSPSSFFAVHTYIHTYICFQAQVLLYMYVYIYLYTHTNILSWTRTFSSKSIFSLCNRATSFLSLLISSEF